MGTKFWKTVIGIGASLCFVLLVPHLAAEDKDPRVEIDRQTEIKRLIEDLDAPSFQKREAASRRLMEIGESTVELLDEATRSPSSEVRTRAHAILRTLHVRPLRAAFMELAKQPDDRISVERGMWLIARILNPKVRREDLSRQLDEIANRVRTRLGANVNPRTADPTRVVEAMRVVIFEEYKFIGNVADYVNPDNSSLEKVLAQRKGLPIILSHIVVAVGDRLGVPIVGLPTPFRYIVKYDASRAPPGFKVEDIFLDAFGGGKVLSRDQFANLFQGVTPESITPGTRRSVLIRMMTNLEQHLFERGQSEKAYQVLEFKQILANNQADDDM